MGLVASIIEIFIGRFLGMMLAYLIFPALLAWLFYIRGYFNDVGFLELEEKLFEPYYDASVKERYRIIGSVGLLGLLPITVTYLLLPEFEYPWVHYFPLSFVGFLYVTVIICYGAILFATPRYFYNNFLAPVLIFLFGPILGVSTLIEFENPFGWTETLIVVISYGLVMLGAIGLLNGSRKIADKKAKSDAELEFAGEVQKKFLQTRTNDDNYFTAYGSSTPARSLGGDFFFLEKQGAEKLRTAIGDVSGHSFGAGLIMVMLKTAFEDHAQYGLSPDELLSILNRKLFRQGEKSMFASLGVVEVDAVNKTAMVWNAGHMPVLHYQASSGNLVEHQHSGVALGLMEENKYTSKTVEVAAGDFLILYSDGMIETRDANGHIREKDHFKDIVNSVLSTSKNPEAAAAQIKKRVSESDFSNSREDDMSLIVIRIN